MRRSDTQEVQALRVNLPETGSEVAMVEERTRDLPHTPSWYPTHHGDLTSRTNLLRCIREWARVHEIHGFTYLEFGVLNGESMVDAIRQLRGPLTHVHGFDTFSGLPKLEAEDRHPDLAPYVRRGNYRGTTRDRVLENIRGATDFPTDRISLHEGDFRVTLKGVGREIVRPFPLCIVLDCDLGSSSAAALEWVADVAEDGTWLLAGAYWEYRGSPKHGQRKAIRDVLGSHPRVEATPYCNYRGLGRAFILNLR